MPRLGILVAQCFGDAPFGMKVRFEILNAERRETNTVELTRQKFVTTAG
jgi:hypothetical protein